MGFLAVVFGVVLILVVLWDAVETVLLPRTVSRRMGLTAIFFSGFGGLHRVVGRSLSSSNKHRERLLGAYGPLSLLTLLVAWAVLLIFGFAMIQWGAMVPMTAARDETGFGPYLYSSAVTFFTLGYGDVAPASALGRTIAVFESGVGFGFLALIIGYIPVLYGLFSRRESTILLLDARAGSPPTASELLARYSKDGLDSLTSLLAEMERWAASLLESYLSYPVLAYYRSQHEKMSWLAAITMVLDTCAILKVLCDPSDERHKDLRRQAELTYAMSRHTAVDLAYILDVPPIKPDEARLPRATWNSIVDALENENLCPADPDAAFDKIKNLRREYESYLNGLSQALFLPLPPWMPEKRDMDNWQVSAWAEKESHFMAEQPTDQ